MEEGACLKCFKVVVFFSPLPTGQKGEGATPCYPPASAPKDGGWSLDNTLETLMWVSIPRILHE